MSRSEFEYMRDHFPYNACAAYWNEHVWKRDDFVRRFSRQKIASMSIEDYEECPPELDDAGSAMAWLKGA